MRQQVLEIENIDVFYGDVQALKGVSLEVPEGSVVALLGPNGAGKTTTLRAISGLVPVRSGRITLDGKEIHSLSPPEVVDSGVAHVPEGRKLFGTLSVRENLELGAYTPRARSSLGQSLERVFGFFPELKGRQAQLAGSLSGGEQQMCAIGRGLMAQPRLIMIDEMSLGLAPLIVQKMFDNVREIAESGITVLLVEQHINRALELADHAYVLEEGSIALSGPADEMAGNEHVRKLYLGI
jgi:branched-chain amino acid transport system ATP-binding protein